jgi:hypothetical protein
MRSSKRKDAETRFLRLANGEEPMTRDRAVEALSALVAAGRVRSPSGGGPPPQIASFDPDGSSAYNADKTGVAKKNLILGGDVSAGDVANLQCIK